MRPEISEFYFWFAGDRVKHIKYVFNMYSIAQFEISAILDSTSRMAAADQISKSPITDAVADAPSNAGDREC